MFRPCAIRVILFAFLAGGPFGGRAEATSLVRFEFDSLVVRAQTIVYVRCLENRSFRDAERGTIFTRTRMKVLLSIKGEPGAEVVLALPGGTEDGRTLVIPGMPRFTPGEEAVLFLSGPDETGSAWPLGLGQGYYPIVAGSDSSQRGVLLRSGITPFPQASSLQSASHQPLFVPLQEFLDRVRQVLLDPSTKDTREPR